MLVKLVEEEPTDGSSSDSDENVTTNAVPTNPPLSTSASAACSARNDAELRLTTVHEVLEHNMLRVNLSTGTHGTVPARNA